MPRYRILHISDLHIASPGNRASLKKIIAYLIKNNHEIIAKQIGNIHKVIAKLIKILYEIYDKDALMALTSTMHDLRECYDAILISGDIANTGTPEDIDYALTLFQKDHIRYMDECLPITYSFDKLDKDIVLVPGNHDRLSNTNGTAFDHYFKGYWNNTEKVNARLLENADIKLAIICADFSLNSYNPLTIGNGRVHDDVLNKLVEKTLELSSDGIASLWMIHFAPNCEHPAYLGTRQGIPLKLVDYKKLTDAAAKANIKHIFCGHTHKSKEYTEATDYGDVKIYCAGTSTCITKGDILRAKCKPIIHLRNISINNHQIDEIQSEDILWYDKEKRFVYDKNKVEINWKQ
ncbi:MAG: metallophosphoesterase [Nitrospirota bacterium]